MYGDITNGKVWHGEVRNRAKDSSMYWLDTTIVPFLGEDRKPRQYVSIPADITERKLAQKEIQELNDEREHRVVERTAQLETSNKRAGSFQLLGVPRLAGTIAAYQRLFQDAGGRIRFHA